VAANLTQGAVCRIGDQVELKPHKKRDPESAELTGRGSRPGEGSPPWPGIHRVPQATRHHLSPTVLRQIRVSSK
jgi:hypothetical protein